jgi:hypothetical protein
MSASRGNGALHAAPLAAEPAANAADAERKPRRVIVMSWFPKFCGTRRKIENSPRTLPYPNVTGNTHGESIMIDRASRMNQNATAFDHDREGKKAAA